MIRYTKAKKILIKSKIKIKNELIESSKSLNRINASDIYSPVNYPAGTNAAFDGFAINSKETKNLNKNNSQNFKILKTISAGDNPKLSKVKKFDAVEVMTGALIPRFFDTVVPIEKIIFYPNNKVRKYITISEKIKKNQHIRYVGSDYKKKDLIIKKGTIIQASQIMAFKTLGIKNIKVKKRPNILFFSTGNEISNDEKIPDWKVRNSNSHYIDSLQQNFLFNFRYAGILKDKHELIFKKKINKFINSKIDLLITSGAISAGKFDFIPSVIKKFKISNYFKGVAIRPGKPVLFGKIKGKNKTIFGLPGNPISSAACFRFFVYPYLLNILGVKKEKPIKAVLRYSFIKKRNLTCFLKSKLNTTNNGKNEVTILKGQESFRIHSYVKSNIWVLLPSGKTKFKKGEIVDCFFQNYSNNILT